MIVAANWKMNLDLNQGKALAGEISASVQPDFHTKVVLCPSFVSLSAIGEQLVGTQIELGAQDLFWESSGAFTGEVSGDMLRSAQCSWVIVGHSERRGRFGKQTFEASLNSYFSDSNFVVSKKFWAALNGGLTPILCVGETIAEREAGRTEAVIEDQLHSVFDGHHLGGKSFVIAYEPVWAIGTGNVCDDAEANKVCAHIRTIVSGRGWAEDNQFELLYGGSVTSTNAQGLFSQPAIGGALVGGASLKADEFGKILQIAEAQNA